MTDQAEKMTPEEAAQRLRLTQVMEAQRAYVSAIAQAIAGADVDVAISALITVYLRAAQTQDANGMGMMLRGLAGAHQCLQQIVQARLAGQQLAEATVSVTLPAASCREVPDVSDEGPLNSTAAPGVH